MSDGLEMLRGFEGFKDTPYWDVNHYRVGYGSDTITKPDGSVVSVQPGMKVSQDDAERDLTRRAGETQSSIKNTIGEATWQQLSPGAKSALTSIHYNYGHLPWDVQQAAASGDPQKIATAIAARGGDNNGINANRRQQEANAVLGINAPGGKFGIGGVTPTSAPSSGGTASSPATALLAGILGKKNPVPAYTPNDPNGAVPQTKLEGLIRAAAGQGTYTPPIVSKLSGLGGSLQALFGGSTTGPGSPPGPAAQQLASTSPATAAPLPASDGSASAGEGGTLIEGRSAYGGSTGQDAIPGGSGSTGPAQPGIQGRWPWSPTPADIDPTVATPRNLGAGYFDPANPPTPPNDRAVTPDSDFNGAPGFHFQPNGDGSTPLFDSLKRLFGG